MCLSVSYRGGKIGTLSYIGKLAPCEMQTLNKLIKGQMTRFFFNCKIYLRHVNKEAQALFIVT